MDTEYVAININNMLSDTDIDELYDHISNIVRISPRLESYYENYQTTFNYIKSNKKIIPSYTMLQICEWICTSIDYAMRLNRDKDVLLNMIDELMHFTKGLSFRWDNYDDEKGGCLYRIYKMISTPKQYRHYKEYKCQLIDECHKLKKEIENKA
jgi:hypothetical protein